MASSKVLTSDYIEEMLLGRQGIKGYARIYSNRFLKWLTSTAKNNFGISMTFASDSEIGIITNWIRENDPNFKFHISNPYILKSNLAGNQPIIKGNFMLKMRNDTFIFVSADTDKDMRKEGNVINIYIFGKKSYYYYSIITKLINARRDSHMLFSISAKGDNDGQVWTCVGQQMNPRPMDTMFFDSGIKETICNHLDTWNSNKEIYKSRGLIYKTGILLYGKAGTGKSSMASAIATYLDCGLINIDTTTFNKLNISEVVESIGADKERYVILIDEIDTLFKSRDDDTATDEQAKCTAKLLSFLDSQQSPDNVVFVATTNYRDRLDKALLRKGRFDLEVKLNDISRKTAHEMCKSFKVPEDDISNILNSFDGDKINPSTLQAKILESLKAI